MIYLDIAHMDLPARSVLPSKFPYLLILNNRELLPYDTQEFYQLDKDSMTVGRGRICDISFSDRIMSKQHFKIWIQDGEWHIQDLDSKNGTFLNNEKMNDVFMLDDGDVIRLGELEVQFCRNL